MKGSLNKTVPLILSRLQRVFLPGFSDIFLLESDFLLTQKNHLIWSYLKEKMVGNVVWMLHFVAVVR